MVFSSRRNNLISSSLRHRTRFNIAQLSTTQSPQANALHSKLTWTPHKTRIVNNSNFKRQVSPKIMASNPSLSSQLTKQQLRTNLRRFGALSISKLTISKLNNQSRCSRQEIICLRRKGTSNRLLWYNLSVLKRQWIKLLMLSLNKHSHSFSPPKHKSNPRVAFQCLLRKVKISSLCLASSNLLSKLNFHTRIPTNLSPLLMGRIMRNRTSLHINSRIKFSL